MGCSLAFAGSGDVSGALAREGGVTDPASTAETGLNVQEISRQESLLWPSDPHAPMPIAMGRKVAAMIDPDLMTISFAPDETAPARRRDH